MTQEKLNKIKNFLTTVMDCNYEAVVLLLECFALMFSKIGGFSYCVSIFSYKWRVPAFLSQTYCKD
jgi:hypothetical protein